MSAGVGEAGLEPLAHVLLRLGRLMLAHGAGVAPVVERIEGIARRWGVVAEVAVSSERLSLTVDGGGRFRTRLGHSLGALGVNLGRLSALEGVGEALLAGSMELGAADARLDAIERAGPLHPGWVVVPCVAVTTACLARLFGAGWAVVGAAFVGGLVSTALRRAFGARGWNPVAAAFLTVLGSGVCGALLLRLVPGAAPTLCLAALGMILVPGVPMINGVRDLVEGHPGMGVARLATATVTVLSIGTGLLAAARLSGAALPVDVGAGPLAVWQDVLLSGVAAVGDAMLFDVPRRALWMCVACGVAGHGLRSVLGAAGLELAAGTLVAAAAVGALATVAGRVLRVPWTCFAFPGVVAMIPGSYAFRAAIGALGVMEAGAGAAPGLVAETMGLGVAALVMTAGVGVGLLLGAAGARLGR